MKKRMLIKVFTGILMLTPICIIYSKEESTNKELNEETLRQQIKNINSQRDSIIKKEKELIALVAYNDSLTRFFEISPTNNQIQVDSILTNDNEIIYKKEIYKKEIYKKEEIVLGYLQNTNTITIYFTFGNLIKFANVKTYIKLTSYESEFKEVKGINFIRYNDLPPGTYTLQLFAFSTDSKLGARSKELRIIVLYWYETSWARILFVLLITVIVYIIYRYRIGQILRSIERKELQYYNYTKVEIPVELRTSIQQYLTFFHEYVKVAKQKDIEFHIEQVDQGLKIRTKFTKEVGKEKIQEWFEEYMGFIKAKMENIAINVEGHPSSRDIDLLVLKLENQIANLNNSLKIAHLENQFLKEDKEFLKLLTLKFADKDTVIHNQYIQDGQQQFADKIDNQKL